MEERFRYELAYSFLPLGDRSKAKQLIETVSDAERLFNDPHLQKTVELNQSIKKAILTGTALRQADKELTYCKDNNITIITLSDPAYPNRLRYCDDSPIVLYQKGIQSLNTTHTLAIIGTRKATYRGKDKTKVLVKELALRCPDAVVISGLAYGIDIAAHEAALNYGLKTIAILAHGLHKIYPSIHHQTANEIIKNGCLISELPFGTEAKPWRFVERNRIIAGMSDGIVVVESAANGGSLHTAEMAFDYGREVFAFPGRPEDDTSRGCNNLIKKQAASLIDEPNDILLSLEWTKKQPSRRKQTVLFGETNQTEKKIMNQFKDKSPLKLSDLLELTQLATNELQSNLLELEIKGFVEQLPGNHYRLKPL